MNNGVLGMVHQWQKLFFGGRYSNTELGRSTNYRKLAEAFGAKGLRITRKSQIRQTLVKAFAYRSPCIIDCVIDPKQRVFPIIPPGKGTDEMMFSDDSMEDAH
jgi:acetolactate synthase-1/2/3 large subunit